MSNLEAELVVLTQNAWGLAPLWPMRRVFLARRIAELRPAVVGLQEVLGGDVRGPLNQAEEIARHAGGYRVWYAPGRIAASGSAEGVALLCRDDVEVLEHSVESLTLDRADRWDGRNQRIVLRAAIRHGGVVIDVLVTHLSLSRRARVRTARELLAFAAKERLKSGSAGAVLMGDFNELPSEEAIRILEQGESGSGWIDAWKHCHRGAPGGTWPAGMPVRRIDYVFVQAPEPWAITECSRIRFAGSDHLGLLTRIRTAPPPRWR